MALTKEDLDNIKLPLSDEDYKMLRMEDARTGYKMWSLASPELRDAFNKKEAERVDDDKRSRKGCFYNIHRTLTRITMGDVEDDCWEDTDDNFKYLI